MTFIQFSLSFAFFSVQIYGGIMFLSVVMFSCLVVAASAQCVSQFSLSPSKLFVFGLHSALGTFLQASPTKSALLNYIGITNNQLPFDKVNHMPHNKDMSVSHLLKKIKEVHAERLRFR